MSSPRISAAALPIVRAESTIAVTMERIVLIAVACMSFPPMKRYFDGQNRT
jgi:hypothetical protein